MKCNVCNKEYKPSCDYNQGRCPHHPALINISAIKEALKKLFKMQ